MVGQGNPFLGGTGNLPVQAGNLPACAPIQRGGQVARPFHPLNGNSNANSNESVQFAFKCASSFAQKVRCARNRPSFSKSMDDLPFPCNNLFRASRKHIQGHAWKSSHK
jgi:hypothetical protein